MPKLPTMILKIDAFLTDTRIEKCSVFNCMYNEQTACILKKVHVDITGSCQSLRRHGDA